MKKVLLVILDGFGEEPDYPGNAITRANISVIPALKKKYPTTFLAASGEAVGVPAGTQGGSEVGHFTIGAGRVVFQSLEAINRSIRDGSFYSHAALLEACARAKKNNGALHLVGMISDQGIHAHIDHLFALLRLARDQKVGKIFIHAITDGRDVRPKSACEFIKKIENRAEIASIMGRYYAMDRDGNWDRTEKAYRLLTEGAGVKEKDPIAAIEHAYRSGTESDYYIEPISLRDEGIIQDSDSVIFWNFRTDRARQLTWAFTGEQKIGFTPSKIVRPHFVCFGPYSSRAPVVFATPRVANNLGEVVSKNGLRQFRIAETEKYAHVTYFFNSQVEKPFKDEQRLMIDSPKCPSYATDPAMSARAVTTAVLSELGKKNHALIVLNFANCDLVGHSGDLNATMRAVEVVDECLGKIVPHAIANDYAAIITGDHGNAEHKLYDDGSPCPTHTRNPVPFILCDEDADAWKIREGDKGLQDIAPTILSLMGLPKPREMTGKSLVI